MSKSLNYGLDNFHLLLLPNLNSQINRIRLQGEREWIQIAFQIEYHHQGYDILLYQRSVSSHSKYHTHLTFEFNSILSSHSHSFNYHRQTTYIYMILLNSREEDWRINIFYANIHNNGATSEEKEKKKKNNNRKRLEKQQNQNIFKSSYIIYVHTIQYTHI